MVAFWSAVAGLGGFVGLLGRKMMMFLRSFKGKHGCCPTCDCDEDKTEEGSDE